jgi:hypothetical protein
MIPQRGSEIFADHRGARPQVLNTVARGQLHEDSYFYTGVVQGANGYREEQNQMPFPWSRWKCSSAGRSGSTSTARPATRAWATGWANCGARLQAGRQSARPGALSQPVSHYFYVMTHGYGAMPDYSAQLTPAGSLGGGGLYPRVAVEPGGHCKDVPAGVQVRTEGRARRGASGVRRAVAHAGDGDPGLSARSPAGNAGMAPANPADPTITIPVSKPAPAAAEVRTPEWLTKRTHRQHTLTTPAELGAPAFVDGWKNARADDVGAIFLGDCWRFGQAQDGSGWDHVLRAWTLGTDADLRLCVGGLALLMVQYCSGGKWGLLLRRPLEAMSRTLPLVFGVLAGVAVFMKRLYLWAQFRTMVDDQVKKGLISPGILSRSEHCIDFKRRC